MFAAPAIIAIDRLMPVKSYASIIAPYKGKAAIDAAMFYCPYMPLELEIVKVTANSRKIGAEWTIELPQTLESYISEDAVDMIVKMMKEQTPL